MSFPSYNDGFNAGREFVKPELDSLKEKLAASQARVAELDEYESLYAQARYALDAAREEARQAQARVAELESEKVTASESFDQWLAAHSRVCDQRDATEHRVAASEAACESLQAALRTADGYVAEAMSTHAAPQRYELLVECRARIDEALAATPPAPEPRDASKCWSQCPCLLTTCESCVTQRPHECEPPAAQPPSTEPPSPWTGEETPEQRADRTTAAPKCSGIEGSTKPSK